MSKVELCCDELNNYVTKVNELALSVGEGKISGTITVDKDNENGVYVLSITDGWNSIPHLAFHYCPFCGKKL